jgi:hypothetical protein
MDLLEDVDYWPALMQFGSTLEIVFTIFTNILEIDEEGRVTNADLAQERAAQWIRCLPRARPSHSPGTP